MLIVAFATTIALVAGLWMWGQTPEYRVLYGSLSDRDGGAVIESLQQMNVPYKFAEGGGALLIPANRVHEVRLRLASQGLPKGSIAGFELMENQKFGTSQFLEQVNYQRALEGELARSMQTLAAVQSARIHLAIPKPSVFAKEQQKPSASVVLALYPGRMLDAGQVSGIIHLISSSVPDMPAKNVTVVDQSGSLLSMSKEAGVEPLDANQIKYIRQIERDYVKRIEAILAPLTGIDNVRAQVTADIDFAQTEQTAEIFKPNLDPKDSSVRSQQKLEAVNGAGQGAGGVPGALSNQPPVPATAPIAAPAELAAAPGAQSNANSRRESTVNYEVDRTIRYTKSPVGAIKRLSAAVVVNNRMVTDKSGKTKSVPLTDAEKAQVTALVKEAMGFDANRGDTLSVQNSPFNPEKEVEEIPFWKNLEYIALAKDAVKYLLVIGVFLFIALKILRPAINSTMVFFQRMEEEVIAARNKAAEQTQQRSPSLPGYQNTVEGARQLAQQDPKLVASVVKEWVGGNG